MNTGHSEMPQFENVCTSSNNIFRPIKMAFLKDEVETKSMRRMRNQVMGSLFNAPALLENEQDGYIQRTIFKIFELMDKPIRPNGNLFFNVRENCFP